MPERVSGALVDRMAAWLREGNLTAVIDADLGGLDGELRAEATAIRVAALVDQNQPARALEEGRPCADHPSVAIALIDALRHSGHGEAAVRLGDDLAYLCRCAEPKLRARVDVKRASARVSVDLADELAERLLVQAIEQLEDVDPFLLGEALLQQGRLEQGRGNREVARDRYERALATFDGARALVRSGQAHGNLAGLELESNSPDVTRARTHAVAAADCFRRAGCLRDLARSLVLASRATEGSAQSLSYTTEAMRIAQESHPDLLAATQLVHAQELTRNRCRDQAEEVYASLEKALELPADAASLVELHAARAVLAICRRDGETAARRITVARQLQQSYAVNESGPLERAERYLSYLKDYTSNVALAMLEMEGVNSHDLAWPNQVEVAALMQRAAIGVTQELVESLPDPRQMPEGARVALAHLLFRSTDEGAIAFHHFARGHSRSRAADRPLEGEDFARCWDAVHECGTVERAQLDSVLGACEGLTDAMEAICDRATERLLTTGLLPATMVAPVLEATSKLFVLGFKTELAADIAAVGAAERGSADRTRAELLSSNGCDGVPPVLDRADLARMLVPDAKPWPARLRCSCGADLRPSIFCCDARDRIDMREHLDRLAPGYAIECTRCGGSLSGFRCDACQQLYTWELGVDRADGG